MRTAGSREALSTARLMMVLSSISPLFLLWALRGSPAIDDRYFVPTMALLVAIPNLILWGRVRAAKSNRERRELVVGRAEDHRDHLLVYLFAMLLPFYADPLDTTRSFLAACAAVVFVIFLFWHLNLHYMNLFFALAGFRVYTLYSPDDDNDASGRSAMVVITRRSSLEAGWHLSVYRMSDTVYLEGAR